MSLPIAAWLLAASTGYAQATQAFWLQHAWYVTPEFSSVSYRGTVRHYDGGPAELGGSFIVDDWTCSWQMHHTELAPCGQSRGRFSDPSSIVRLECLTSRGDGFSYEHHCHDGSRGVSRGGNGSCEPVEQPATTFTLHDQVHRRRRAEVREARVSIGCETHRVR